MDIKFSTTYHDSRDFTNYEPRCVVNERLQELANTDDSNEVRHFLTKNGKTLIKNKIVIDNKKCFTCSYDDRIRFYKEQELKMLEEDSKKQDKLEKVQIKGSMESKRLKTIAGVPGIFAEILYLAGKKN